MDFNLINNRKELENAAINYLNQFVSNINHINLPKSRPFKPFEQLLMVLPAESRDLLPNTYQSLMVDPMSDIIEYYPKSYQIRYRLLRGALR